MTTTPERLIEMIDELNDDAHDTSIEQYTEEANDERTEFLDAMKSAVRKLRDGDDLRGLAEAHAAVEWCRDRYCGVSAKIEATRLVESEEATP